MNKKMLILLCGLFFAITAEAKVDVCKSATKDAHTYESQLPIILDNVTTLVNYVVNCPSKTIRHEKQISVDTKKLSKPILIKILKRFIIRQCTIGHAKDGWTIIEHYYDNNMRLVFVFVAKPSNCETQKTPLL